MKKLFKITFCLLLTLVLFTGCDLVKKTETKDTTKNEKPIEEKTKSKGNCDVLKCLNKLDYNNTLEDVNKVIGFEGEKKQEGNGWTTYIWELNENESVEATFYSSSASIKINFKDDIIKNDKVDFSSFADIKSSLNKGETITYDEIKEKFKGEGTLVEISSSSKKYRWVNSKGGYLNANFSNTTGRCTMIMGMI